jgi:hypothetical protein
LKGNREVIAAIDNAIFGLYQFDNVEIKIIQKI